MNICPFLRAQSKAIVQRTQPREAEALNLKEALSWTKQWIDFKCVFELDAKGLLDTINGSDRQSYFDAMVEDCNKLIKQFKEVLVIFVPRSANTVAHLLAKEACFMSNC